MDLDKIATFSVRISYTVKFDDVRCSQQFEMSRLSFLFKIALESIKQVQPSEKYLLVMYFD